MILTQWYVPLQMVYENEEIIRTGKILKLRTRPVDPTDLMRGKYITLSFADNTLELPEEKMPPPQKEYYLTFRTDSAGFDVPAAVVSQPPSGTETYLRVEGRNYFYDERNDLIITYPFDRFYLEESKAPAAEQAYRDSAADRDNPGYALVSVKNGRGVVTDVIVNGKSVTDVNPSADN